MTKDEKDVYVRTLEMFDYRCALCGNPRIQCHHIRFGSLRGGRRTYMGNIIPLCKEHHDMAHHNKKKYMRMLIEIVDRRMHENNIESTSTNDK